MKKTLKILVMLLFCICPVLLAACEAVDYFSITAMTSDDSLGRIDGQSEEKIAGGTEITLVGSSFKADNPLLCWIKNNETIVKIPEKTDENGNRDNTLKLVAGEETEGQYTAIFAEPASSMRYAYISNYTTSITDLFGDSHVIGNEHYSIEMSYAVMTAGTNNYFPFNCNIKSGNANVLYFGGLGENYEYKFTAKITIAEKNLTINTTAPTPDGATAPDVEVEEAEVTFTLSSSVVVNNDSFDSFGNCTRTISYTDDYGVELISTTITLSKINQNIYQFVDSAESV